MYWYYLSVIQLPDTKILKGRKRKAQPGRERSRFAFVKAMVLASADKRIQSGVSSAAQFGFDGHLVELSEEFVLQRPSIARSKVWEVNAGAKAQLENHGTGELRVCWQCPELGRTFLQRNDTF